MCLAMHLTYSKHSATMDTSKNYINWVAQVPIFCWHSPWVISTSPDFRVISVLDTTLISGVCNNFKLRKPLFTQ